MTGARPSCRWGPSRCARWRSSTVSVTRYEPELIERAVPLRVLNKLVPRYVDKQSDPIHGVVFSLTDEGQAALISYRRVAGVSLDG